MRQEKTWIRIQREHDVTRAVLAVDGITKSMGFRESPRYMITTAVSELVRNILKYAGTGDITVIPLKKGIRNGIEIIVRDNGPGIADIEAAMADHYSSSGTLGLGLPGVKRLMDEFEIESALGEGTRVTVRKWK